MSEPQPATSPEPAPDSLPPPSEPPRSGSGGALAWVLAVVILLAVAGGWFYLRHRPAPTPKVAPSPAPVAQAQPKPLPEAPELPPSQSSDTQVRTWAARLGPPRLMSWMKGSDWVRRIAATINQLSLGKSPRAVLPFLAPGSAFAVETRDGQKVISAKSFARWDGFGDVVSGVNVSVAAKAWKALHPLLDAAWRQIAPPSRSLDQGLAEALSPLIEAPVPAGAISVVPKGAVWAFADPKLEALTPAQKQLVRMGAKNERRVQTKLAAFLRAVRIPLVPPSP